MKKLSTMLSVLAFFAACVAVVVAVSEFISRRRDMFEYDDEEDCNCCDCDCFDGEVFEDDLSFETEQEAACEEQPEQPENNAVE